MEQPTTEVDERLMGVATMAAHLWALDHQPWRGTQADYTRGLVTTAVMHLIEQGLLTVPDDLPERLDQPIEMKRTSAP